MARLLCPECNAPMVLRTTTKFTYPNGEPRRFYGCSRWPACNAAHGAHPDGTPLGVPANKETKEARIRAHAAFDPHWRGKGLTRKEAYRLLQQIMNLPAKDAHIAQFNIEQCEELIRRIAAPGESNEGQRPDSVGNADAN